MAVHKAKQLENWNRASGEEGIAGEESSPSRAEEEAVPEKSTAEMGGREPRA